MEATSRPKLETLNVYEYLCVRTCFFLGKRWFAGSKYVFNRELSGTMTTHFEQIRVRRVRAEPSDELLFENVGRERSRPSEYETEYTGEIE